MCVALSEIWYLSRQRDRERSNQIVLNVIKVVKVNEPVVAELQVTNELYHPMIPELTLMIFTFCVYEVMHFVCTYFKYEVMHFVHN